MLKNRQKVIVTPKKVGTLHRNKSILKIKVSENKRIRKLRTNMFKYSTVFAALIASLIFKEALLAQANVIPVKNASFEDFPQPSHVPNLWHDCGMLGESPPDILPHPAFQVSTKPQQGNSYIGLVTRDNETYEGVSQKLGKALEKDHCYDFSIWAARSKNYVSVSKTSGNLENFNKAIKFIIWGGNSDCDKRENLFESKAIDNTNWELIAMKLKPKGTYAYIFIEAYYVRKMVPYNGNILLDNASAIVEDNTCNKPLTKDSQPPPIAAVDQPRRPTRPKRQPSGDLSVRVDSPRTVVVSDPPKETKIREARSFDKIDVAKVAVNDRFSMNSVLFEVDSYTIKEGSYEQLDKLADFLKNNNKIAVEIGGHTNGKADPVFAIELSTSRANAVADYLRGKGVDETQLKTKGYGRVYPVATNETKEGQKLNQRVEVKIIRIR
ncbi:MAG: hypothetical protein RI894_1708 [Bacteroidota bacterium]|jgi:outer membrane protein OmpA-like peptidoglycan-associated protein